MGPLFCVEPSSSAAASSAGLGAAASAAAYLGIERIAQRAASRCPVVPFPVEDWGPGTLAAQ